MREASFVKQNAEKWKQFESLLAERKRADPDQLADLFVQLTDDLSYARTFFPESKPTQYLNGLAGKVHLAIYKNRREKGSRFITFWKYELPMVMYESRRELFYAALMFFGAALIGALSAANDPLFIRLILGDGYVNKTLENIAQGKPMDIYGQSDEGNMFVMIAFNNIWVALMAFAKGIFLSFGTALDMFRNGVMVGAFQYFFYERGLLLVSALAIWLHGTLEISAIVIAGAAGLVMGNSIMFPKTFTRVESFTRGAKRGLKMVIGLVPIFITAAFLESFVTRHSDVVPIASAAIILGSLAFVIWYFIIYPLHLYKRSFHGAITTH